MKSITNNFIGQIREKHHDPDVSKQEFFSWAMRFIWNSSLWNRYPVVWDYLSDIEPRVKWDWDIWADLILECGGPNFYVDTRCEDRLYISIKGGISSVEVSGKNNKLLLDIWWAPGYMCTYLREHDFDQKVLAEIFESFRAQIDQKTEGQFTYDLLNNKAFKEGYNQPQLINPNFSRTDYYLLKELPEDWEEEGQRVLPYA